MAGEPLVSVLMPVYAQAAFLPRALESLLQQSFAEWECIVLDDGSAEPCAGIVRDFGDLRFRHLRHEENRGLGAALNLASAEARAPLLAYLPADDIYHRDHLASLVEILDSRPEAVLAYAGVRYQYNRTAEGIIPGERLQLVQAMHRRTADRWLERDELTTDDLDRMFWTALGKRGEFAGSGRITCEWVDHPRQRHKLIREPIGGVNAYRSHYRPRRALTFHSTAGGRVDEPAMYGRFAGRERTQSPDGLKIVLVGELAYNPERILALEEAGHRLYGLWMPDPHGYNTVGPLPFGNVQEIPRSDWRAEVRRIQPDLFYGLLNWQAVPWAHHVLMTEPDVPFVWHFKEGPFICLNRGTWPQLADLYVRSAGQIYVSEEMRRWLCSVLPEPPGEGLVLDGDLPKREWFGGTFAARLSAGDGEFHTVVPGRPIGLHPPLVKQMADHNIHLHFYGEAIHGQWREWIETVNRMAPGYLHLHPNVDQRRWAEEFSQYDAGWLHFFSSRNGGELARADWDDLNIPARIGPLLAAGLPLLQRDNRGAIAATQSLVEQFDIGLCFSDMAGLAAQLQDGARMEQVRANVTRHRMSFTFDHHVSRLTHYFRRAISR